MSKKTLALIIGLILLIVLLVTIAGQKQPPPVPATPTPTPYAQTVLQLKVSQSATGTNNTSSVDVVANTGANKITGAQFTLSYDPKVLKTVTITPGTFLKSSTVMRKIINQQLGTIDYIIAIPPDGYPAQGSGVLATVHYTVLGNQSATTTEMSFTGKTLVAASGVKPSVLKSTWNATIPLTK